MSGRVCVTAEAELAPGDALRTLAEVLRGQVEGGALTRRLHSGGR
ncbi:hypothetical protein [Parafrankia sp. FMc2]